MRTGVIGGPLADRLLRRLGEARKGYCDGSSCLVFTEQALIRWRSGFKSDGATRFEEVESALSFEAFEMVPIRRLRALANPLTREFVTSFVRCRLRPRVEG